MNFLQRMLMALQRFMNGRYGGIDALNFALMILYVIFCILQIFFRNPLVYILSFLPAIAFIFRMLSRNISARQRENQKFLEITAPVQKIFRKYRRRIRDGKTYKYFSCPNCHKELRVPRGRGNIEITCPHCRHHFQAKS